MHKSTFNHDAAQAPRLSTCCDQGTHTVECQLHTPKKRAAKHASAARIIRHAPLNPEHAVTDAATSSATSSHLPVEYISTLFATLQADIKPQHAFLIGQCSMQKSTFNQDAAQAPRLSTCCDQGTHTVECQLHTPKKRAANHPSAARIMRHAPLNPEHAVTDAATSSATSLHLPVEYMSTLFATLQADIKPQHAFLTGQCSMQKSTFNQDAAQAPRLSTCCDQGTHTVECQLHTPKKRAANHPSAARIIRHAPLNPEHAVTDAATSSATSSHLPVRYMSTLLATLQADIKPQHAFLIGQCSMQKSTFNQDAAQVPRLGTCCDQGTHTVECQLHTPKKESCKPAQQQREATAYS